MKNENIKNYSSEELKKELDERKKRKKLVRGAFWQEGVISSLEGSVIKELKRDKGKIISRIVSANQKEIEGYVRKVNDYLAKQLNVDAKPISKKEIKEYIIAELNGVYEEIIERTEPDYCEEHRVSDWSGTGFSGSNGGPIGHLEKISKEEYFGRR